MTIYNYSALDLSLNSVYSFIISQDENKEKFTVSVNYTCEGSFLSGTNKVEILINKKLFISYTLNSLILTFTQDQKNTTLSDNDKLFDYVMIHIKIHFQQIIKQKSKYFDQRFMLFISMIQDVYGDNKDDLLPKHMISENTFLKCFDYLIEHLQKSNIEKQIYIKVMDDFIKEYKVKKGLTETFEQIQETPKPDQTQATEVTSKSETISKPKQPIKKVGSAKKERTISLMEKLGHDIQCLKSGYIVDGKKYPNLDSICRNFKLKLVK